MPATEVRKVVLIGVDGSADSDRAVMWAAQYAALHKFGLRALLVRPEQRRLLIYQPDQSSGDAARNAEESALLQKSLTEHVIALVPARASLGCDGVVVTGDAAGSIMIEADRDEVALVVLGRRGRGGFTSLLLGSVSDQVAAYGRRNTVVVPTEAALRDHPVMVVGVDGSAAADSALRWSAEVAGKLGGSVVVVSCWQVPYGPLASTAGAATLALSGPDVYSRRAHEVAEAAVKRSQLEDAELPHAIATPEGPTAEALLATAEHHRADVVVVGNSGRNPIARLALGSVAHSVLHHATIPVAVIHSAPK